MPVRLFSRRAVGVVAAALTATAMAGCGSDGGPGGDGGDGALTVSVGRQPQAAGNSPITQYMIDNELFEKAAADHGYDLTVDWRDYPNAPPQVEAMIADRLDIGMWGNTPVVRAIAQDQPISVVAVGEGHLRFVLLTTEGTGITQMSDLEGKRVGVTIGADPHLAFLRMLEGELGTSDVDSLGINLVNMPTQAASAQVPSGVDATVAIYPAFLAEQAKGSDVVPVINSFGQTEAGYEGDLGSGEGLDIPSAADSPFAPEGFYSHRSFWVARDALIEEHPDLVSAFTEAIQESITALGDMSDEEVAGLVTQYWGEPALGAKVVGDELLFQRGWAWATNGDGEVILKLSQSLADAGVIDAPLDWESTRTVFETASEAVGKGYEEAGEVPAEDEFTDDGQSDTRGAPQWELGSWTSSS